MRRGPEWAEYNGAEALSGAFFCVKRQPRSSGGHVTSKTSGLPSSALKVDHWMGKFENYCFIVFIAEKVL